MLPHLCVAYSLTETASAVAMTRPDDPLEKQYFTVGRPFEGTEMRTLDLDGTVLPEESLGELAVRVPV